MDAFGKPVCFQIQPDDVLSRIGQISEPPMEAEHEENARVVAERDSRVPPFDPVQGGAAQHGALGHEFGGDAAAPAGVPEISAELAEHGEGRERKGGVAV